MPSRNPSRSHKDGSCLAKEKDAAHGDSPLDQEQPASYDQSTLPGDAQEYLSGPAPGATPGRSPGGQATVPMASCRHPCHIGIFAGRMAALCHRRRLRKAPVSRLSSEACHRLRSRDHRYIAIESGTVVVVVIGNPRQTGHEKTDVYELRPRTWPGPMETTKCEGVLSLLRRLRLRQRQRLDACEI
jgi:hypothetical protein